jgi:hypothetical protein
MAGGKKIVETLQVAGPDKRGSLKPIGGSDSDDFCNVLVNQVCSSLWKKNSDPDERQRQMLAVVAAMMGMQPRDELDGMLIGQLIASHNAAMECYRRAMIGEQTFEGRRENLTQANRLCRSYAALVEALDRHRGKGQQYVKVEHVHVHQGGQAIVGAVTQGGRGAKKTEGPDAEAIARRRGLAELIRQSRIIIRRHRVDDPWEEANLLGARSPTGGPHRRSGWYALVP